MMITFCYCCLWFSCCVLDYHVVEIENPRVGGSIPPPATIYFKGLYCFGVSPFLCETYLYTSCILFYVVSVSAGMPYLVCA